MKQLIFILLVIIGVVFLCNFLKTPEQRTQEAAAQAAERARAESLKAQRYALTNGMIYSVNLYFKAHPWHPPAFTAEDIREAAAVGMQMSEHTFSSYEVVTEVDSVSEVTPVTFNFPTSDHPEVHYTGYTARLHCTNHLFERLPGSRDWEEFDKNPQGGKAWFYENGALAGDPEMDKEE